MATYIDRKYSGRWLAYQLNKPDIQIRLYGYRNNNANIGCWYGHTGVAKMTSDKTYMQMGADGKHAYGISVWFNGSSYIAGLIGISSVKIDSNGALKNDREFKDNKYRYITFPENITDIRNFFQLFQLQADEYDFYNDKDIVGVKKFSAELYANCPIIKCESNRRLVLLKDGTKVPLTTSVLLDDIAESEFLNGKDLNAISSTFYISTSATSYTLKGNGDKYNIINMTANTSWTESNESRDASPYLVKTNFSGIDCLKLFLTSKLETSTYLPFSDDNANYGLGNKNIDISVLYDSYPSIDTSAGAILKNLGYYYAAGEQKKQNGGVLNVIQTTKFSTNIPIFSDEGTGADWSFKNAYGDKDEANEILKDNALNYDDISGDANTFNPIGDSIDSMGIDAGYTQQAMSTQFALPYATLNELANNLFNTDVSLQSAITDGLKMYGANPINCIIDLQFYPFNVTDYIQNSIDSYIYFGSYKMDFEGSLNKLYNTKCVIDCGTLIYPEQTRTYRDYEPFSELYIYLPYIGVNKLDVAQYINKVITLKYIVDILTGNCIAVLFANEIIIDSFGGSIGAKQCISSIDYASYAQSKVKNVSDIGNNMLKFAGGGLQGLTGTTGSVDIANGAIGFAHSLYNGYQSQNAQHITIRGSVTPTTSYAMPQYAYFYTVINEVINPENEQNLIGYPSISGGKVRDFSGFLSCSKVSLMTSASVEETREIYNLLANGIYI